MNSTAITANDKAAITNFARDYVTRENTAKKNFVEVLMNLGGITEAEAEKAMATMLQFEVAKIDAINGVVRVKHGAFLEKYAIENAAAYVHVPKVKKEKAQKG